MNREQIVATARAFVGTKVVHQGRVPGVGMDCGGVVACTSSALGFLQSIDIDDKNYRGVNPMGWPLYRVLRSKMDEVDPNMKQPGCVLLWWIKRRKPGKPLVPQHIGIWTGKTIIHAVNEVGRVVENTYDNYWMERVVAAFDFRLAGATPAHSVEEKCKECEDAKPCECGKGS